MVSGKGALSGATAGATIGSVIPGLGTIAGGVIGGLGGLFMGGDKDDIKLEDLRTPEQKQAAAALQQLGMTGQFGNINLGEAFGGSLGDFQSTGIEQGGLQGLAGLLRQGPSGDVTKARETFGNLADTTFDPSDPTSGFAEFSRQLARSGRESEDILNREAAITGSRFGTGIQRRKVDLGERLQDIRGGRLVDIFQRSRQQQLAGAQGLQSLEQQEQGRRERAIEGALQMGGLERNLSNQQAQAELDEFKRQRGETLSRVGLLSQEASRNPYLGISSIPGGQTSFQELTSSVLGSIGQGLGSELGSSLFSGGSGGIGSSGGISSGNVPGTGLFGSKFGGKTQSEILGFNTQAFRSA